MLTLIEKGMTREQAYDLVQPKTAYSWDNQVDFKPLLEADPEVTSRLTRMKRCATFRINTLRLTRAKCSRHS